MRLYTGIVLLGTLAVILSGCGSQRANHTWTGGNTLSGPNSGSGSGQEDAFRAAYCNSVRQYVSDLRSLLVATAAKPVPEPIDALRIMSLRSRNQAFVAVRNIPETCGNTEFDPPLTTGLFSEQWYWDGCEQNPNCETRPMRPINYCDPLRRFDDWAHVQTFRVLRRVAKNIQAARDDEPLLPFDFETDELDNFRDTAVCDAP